MPSLVACGDDGQSCATTTSRYEQLRAEALRVDPALSAHPELAAEHLRQTHAVFVAPLQARCATNPQLDRCIARSTTFSDAQRCL